jgi:hypothetical protein
MVDVRTQGSLEKLTEVWAVVDPADNAANLSLLGEAMQGGIDG